MCFFYTYDHQHTPLLVYRLLLLYISEYVWKQTPLAYCRQQNVSVGFMHAHNIIVILHLVISCFICNLVFIH